LRAQRASDPAERRRLDVLATELVLRTATNNADAIAAWQGIIERHGPVAEALDRLIALLDAEGRNTELARVLEERLATTDGVAKAPLWIRLGRLESQVLGNDARAIQCYGEALKLEPSNRALRSELAKWLEVPMLRGAVVRVLEPVLRGESPTSLLVDVLKAKVEDAENDESKLEWVAESLSIASDHLARHDDAFALAVTGLGLAMFVAPSRARDFLAAAAKCAPFVDAATRVAVLGFALGQSQLNTPESRGLAALLSDGLAESGEPAAAIDLLRRALAEEPASPELLARMDDLLAAQASPEERVQLYSEALARETRVERRRDIYARMAALTQQHFHTPEKAIELWNEVLTLDETHFGAHQALVQLYSELGDDEALKSELKRVLTQTTGERKLRTLDAMVEVELRTGEHEQALAHALAAIEQGGAEDDARVTRAEQLARELGQFEIVERLLEMRVKRTSDPTAKMKILASLGKIRATLQKSKAASDAFYQAAELAEEHKSMVRAADLLESALTADGSQDTLIHRLWEVCLRSGDLARLERPLRAMLRLGLDEKDVVRRLTEVASRVAASGDSTTVAALVDVALADITDPARRRQLLLLRAKALRTDPNTYIEAAKTYRKLLDGATSVDDEVWAAYQQLFEQVPDGDVFRAELRWFYERRVALAADPIRELLTFARIEETRHSDDQAALRLYERVLEVDSERLDVWMEMARLRKRMGDLAGLVDALGRVAALSDGAPHFEALVERADVLGGPLGRSSEALDVVESLLSSHPGDPALLTIVRRALDDASVRTRAASVLEQVAVAVTDTAARAEVLETLLRVTAGAGDFDEARTRWTLLLIDTYGDNFDMSLGVALRMATELPSQSALWDRAEKLARRLSRPEPVIAAYEAALQGTRDPGLAEEIGRRLVEFYEEWSEDSEQVVSLLERVYELSRADWAFDRLKLAFNAAGRWSELFALYDRALDHLEPGPLRLEVLREAAMAAKDFASDSDRAIHYFVQLDELEPGDVRVEAAIERLYERQGQTRPLIELLTRQMAAADGDALYALRARVAGLWLDIDEPVAGFGVVERMLTDREYTRDAVGLLERIVALPSSKNASLPEETTSSSGSKKEKSKDKVRARPAIVRHKAAVTLRQYYEGTQSVADVVRMLEIEVEHAFDDRERVDRLNRVIRIRLDELKDAAGAFEDLTALLALQPDVVEHRQLLDELASRTNNRVRQARLLASVSERQDSGVLSYALRLEAADVFREHVQDFDQAIELYARVLDAAGAEAARLGRKESKKERAFALTAARHLDPLLEQTGRAEERASVLERLAGLETSEVARRRALLAAAEVCATKLGAQDRAVRLYREQLGFDSEDTEARDGLVVALERAREYSDLVVELEARASRSKEPSAARLDRGRIAHLSETVLGDSGAAIDAWRRVRELHGRDLESFDALVRLLSAGGRWAELAEHLRLEAEVESDESRAAELRRRLGRLYRSELGDAVEAVRAFVAAEDWELAITVVRESRHERDLVRRVCREVFDLGVSFWRARGGDASTPAALAAAWALAELGLRLREAGAYAEVVSLLLEGAELPFHRSEKRALERDAAYLCSDQLKDTERAIAIFERIFREDSSDEIAVSSVSRFARLLEEVSRYPDVVALWEDQAQVRFSQGDKPTAAALWQRAAALSEEWLKDVERAVTDFKRAADLGLDSALEALARIYTAQGEHLLAANFLERLCAQSSREALGDRALQLAAAYVAAMREDKARACLEAASAHALNVGPVRRRLGELYQAAESWEPLASLYAVEAGRTADQRERFRLLDAAARVHVERRFDHAAAVPFLEQSVALDPEDSSLRLRLAEALMNSTRHADAALVLRAQLERYGTRRPKERAIVHFALARAFLGQGDRAAALEELVHASRIDPAHPRILHLQARLSLEVGELTRAEKTYRALLLVLGRRDDAEAPSRAEALLDLSLIASQNQDQQRATESIESAFEAAAESTQESLALERGLRALGRLDLLGRALRDRLERSKAAGPSALALAELTALHAGALGNLSEVSADLRRRAEGIESQLEQTALGDEQAWGALGKVYEQLGDVAAESRITERRVRGWLTGTADVQDPEPLYRLATLRLAEPSAEDEALQLLSRAAEVKPDFERLDGLLGPHLDSRPDWEPGLALLESVARRIGRSDLVARALARRLQSESATVEQYEEALALARKSADDRAIEPLLIAASDGPLAVRLPGEVRAAAELELAEHLTVRGEIDRALVLRENAAAFVEPERRRSLLLDVARVASERMQDHERAIAIYVRLWDESPNDVAFFRPLLELLRKTQDVERQSSVIARALPLVEAVDDRIALQLEQARLAIGRGDVGAAADLLRDVLRDDPNHSDAALLLAGILERSGRFAELVNLLTKQLANAEQARDEASVLQLGMRVAELYEKQSRYEEALSAFELVLGWKSGHHQALRSVVRIAEALGDLERAAAALEELLGLPGIEETTQLLERLIWLRERLGDDVGVERAMLRAFDANPHDRILCDALVARYRARGDIGTVANVLDRAVRAYPEDLELAIRLASAYREAGQFEDALAVIEGLYASGVETVELQRERGRALSALGRHEEALSCLEAGDPSSVEGATALLEGIRAATPGAAQDFRLHLGLREAGLLEQLGQLEECRDVLDGLDAHFPRQLSVLGAKARLAAASGDVEGAVDAYVGLSEVVEGDELVTLAMELSAACEQLGTPERARGALERAVSTAPTDALLRSKLCNVYRLLGANRELAGLLLDEARQIEDLAQRQARLLEIAELLGGPEGDPSQAESVLAEARELGPDNLDVVILLARAKARAARSDEALVLLNEVILAQRGRRSRALVRVYHEMSQIQLNEGFLTDAFESLQRATEIDIRNGGLATELGRLALEIDEREIAQKTFGRVALMRLVEPDSPEGAQEGVSRGDRADANFYLGAFARELGDVRKARMLFQKALSDNPAHEGARAAMAELG
jgi:tetratricopeptide (TPR) repeat protein